MRGRGLAIVAVVASGLASPQANAAPKIKQPTGHWTVETQANECLLVRPYGTPTNPLFLALSQAPMGANAGAIILYDREWALFKNGEAFVQFDGGEPIEIWFSARLLWNLSKKIKKLTMRSVEMGIDTKPRRLLSNAVTATFNVPGEIRVTFALTDHGKALKALDECATKLGVKWGYPVDEQRRVATPPFREGGLRGLFTPADYPASVHKDGRMGRAHVRLRISEAGAIDECSVVRSSGSAELDTVTCKVFRERAKFEPARDVDGKPTRGLLVTSVRWILV